MVTNTEERMYSTKEIAAVVGVSYRMIDYWCRQEALTCARPATGSGSRREFSRVDVARAQVLANVATALSVDGDPNYHWPLVPIGSQVSEMGWNQLTGPDITFELPGFATLTVRGADFTGPRWV